VREGHPPEGPWSRQSSKEGLGRGTQLFLRDLPWAGPTGSQKASQPSLSFWSIAEGAVWGMWNRRKRQHHGCNPSVPHMKGPDDQPAFKKELEWREDTHTPKLLSPTCAE
jgi:hypothetical protein